MSSGLPPNHSNDRCHRLGRALLIFILCGVGRLSSGSASRDVLLAQIQDLIPQGDLTTASTRLSSALKQVPREPGFYNFLGVVEARQANFTAAESSFKKAVELQPQFTSAWLNLGLPYQQASFRDPGNVRKALDACLALLKFQPDNVHIRMQKYADARAELERAHEIGPANFRVNANLLILYQRTKDPRAEAQQARFEQIKQKLSENEQLLWRTIGVRPY